MLLPDHTILKKDLAIANFVWQSIGRSFFCKIDKQMTKGVCNTEAVLLLNPPRKLPNLAVLEELVNEGSLKLGIVAKELSMA